MAEFKTAEQYVVEKVELLEIQLDAEKKENARKLAELQKEYEKTLAELADAYDLLNMFRDFIEVRKNDYFGNCICVDNIYEKEHPEEVARIMEYFDLRIEEDSSDE